VWLVSGPTEGGAVNSPLTPREKKAHELIDALALGDAWAEKFKRYRTTAHSCECIDWLVRGRRRHEIEACKHMLAFRLLATREDSVA
jgi:hypothetical protein